MDDNLASHPACVGGLVHRDTPIPTKKRNFRVFGLFSISTLHNLTCTFNEGFNGLTDSSADELNTNVMI